MLNEEGSETFTLVHGILDLSCYGKCAFLMLGLTTAHVTSRAPLKNYFGLLGLR